MAPGPLPLIHASLSPLITAWLLSSPSLSLHFVSEPRSWEDARSYCREKYSDLATPDSMEEMSRLLQSVEPKYQGDVWIGLKGGAQPRWLWSGNATLQYTNWRSGEPSGNLICAQSHNTGWFVRGCRGFWWFLCYTENSSPKYVMIRTTKTWLGAQSYCRDHHIDLASIESEEDEELVRNVTEGRPVWIGLFKDFSEWVGEGNSSFRYWASNTDMNGNGDGNCVAVRTTEEGRWYRHMCDEKLPFVCQKSRKSLRFVRLTVAAKEGVDLNNPNLRATLLEQMTENLKKQTSSDNINLKWLEDEDGQVFSETNDKQKMRRLSGDGEL